MSTDSPRAVYSYPLRGLFVPGLFILWPLGLAAVALYVAVFLPVVPWMVLLPGTLFLIGSVAAYFYYPIRLSFSDNEVQVTYLFGNSRVFEQSDLLWSSYPGSVIKGHLTIGSKKRRVAVALTFITDWLADGNALRRRLQLPV